MSAPTHGTLTASAGGHLFSFDGDRWQSLTAPGFIMTSLGIATTGRNHISLRERAELALNALFPGGWLILRVEPDAEWNEELPEGEID